MPPAAGALLLIPLITVVSSELSGCFTIQRGKRLECATSIIRRSPVTEAECRQLCLTQPADCLAVNYNYYKRICELFDVTVDQASPASPVLRRLVRDVRCSAGASLVHTIGVNYLQPKAECLLPKDRSNVRLAEPKPPVISVSMPMDTEEQPPKNPFSDVVMLPIVPDCPIGERARVQIIDGVTVAHDPTVSFNVDMPEKCIETCRMNTYPSGSRLPLLCRSATFDRRTSKCAVYPDALNPNGYLDYRPDNVVLYMEKLCFPDTVLPLSCNELFRRVPQHILLGHAAEIVTASSQTECVKECILAKLRHVDCHSVLHYMDVPYQNCILNIHSRHSRPEYFLPEVRMKVDYIEVPACATSVVSEQNDAAPLHEKSPDIVPATATDKYPPSEEKGKGYQMPPMSEGRASVEFDWSEWSPCDPLKGLRERQRVCTDCKETVQNEPCFPNDKNEFNEALEKFVEDQEKLERLEAEKMMKEVKLEESDEKAGFMAKLPPTKVISFPVREEEGAVKKEPSPGNVEFFGPPIKQEDPQRLYSY